MKKTTMTAVHSVRRVLLLFATVLLTAMAYGQGTYIKGKVTDTEGEPLVGAYVQWKGSKTGYITDADGIATIPSDGKADILVISYLGHKTMEKKVAKGEKAFTAALTVDAQHLDELVVVGYGIQKKSSITGAVETIKAEDLLTAPVTNIDQALTAQVAGLQVMQSSGDPSTAKESAIRIRGINSAPLLVIDGVPRFGTTTSDGETRLSDLNPDDIESITILKDAASAAVYGARAANGVILVQTKSAKNMQKVHVNYRGQYNVQQATHMPEFLGAYDYALLYNRAVENTPGTTNTAYTDEQLDIIRRHASPNVYGDEDYLSYLDKTGWSTSHSISANGGTKSVRYYLSAGYSDSRGLYSGVGRKRLNYMAKIDADLAKNLTLTVSMNGSRTKAKNSS